MLEKAINNNASILSLCFVYVDFSSYGHVLDAMFTISVVFTFTISVVFTFTMSVVFTFTISVVFTFTMSYRVAIHSVVYSPTWCKAYSILM